MNISPKDRLIVDLGMHRGDDTAFYLEKGFKVLAVEAAPQLVKMARERFAGQLRNGDLEIHQVAIADHEGEIEFHLSDEDLWGSTRADMADRGFGAHVETIVVPCATLDSILSGYPTPYFIKIDIEGRDLDCVMALTKLRDVPYYLSFEADLTDPNVTESMLNRLDDYGYRRFKIVNQATHSFIRMPFPSLEGDYVDVQFTKHMSGPFGEEAPGSWMELAQVRELYRRIIKRQAARIEYSSKGTVFGLRLSRFHRHLERIYNNNRITRLRTGYARLRNVEVGGWFDIHAAL